MFNKHFQKVVCLSLASRLDRRKAFDKQATDLGFSFEYIDATPGINYKGVRVQDTFQQNHNHASYAHSLDMANLFEKCLKEGIESVLFFEDDCVLSKNVLEELDKIELPETWDLFYLGAWHTKPPVDLENGLHKAVHAQMSHAVAINRRVMPLLIHYCHKNEQLFDLVLAKKINPLGMSFCLFPDLAIQSDGYSNIWQTNVSHKRRWNVQ
jgi:GR25 family glycosyltransferase involved in LPS biosynthesis